MMDKDILKIYLWATLNCIQNNFFQEESGRGGMSRQLDKVWPTSEEMWESGGQLWVNTNNTSFNIWLRFQKTIVQSPSQCSATRYKKLMWLEPLHCSATRPDPYWGRYGGWWRGRWRGHRPSQTPLSPLELHLPQFHHDGGNWYKHQKLYISVSVKCNYGTGCKKMPPGGLNHYQISDCYCIYDTWKCLFCHSWTWFQ